jgi:hypothetical protein
VRGQHLAHDLDGVLVLEDAAVARVGQEPQPGLQGDEVAGQIAVRAALLRLGDVGDAERELLDCVAAAGGPLRELKLPGAGTFTTRNKWTSDS